VRATNDLTPRETEVMRTLLHVGGSTKETARRLGITRQRVRQIRSTVYSKTYVKSAYEFWAKFGWIR